MKKYYYIKLFISFCIIHSFSLADYSSKEGIGYGVLTAAADISISKLLEYENIASVMPDLNDRSRFYSVITIEIQRRINDLDQKFNNKKVFYINKINQFEDNLNLPKYIKRMPVLNLSEISLISNQLIFSDDYLENKKNADIVAKLYRKKLIIYRQSLKNYRNYFIALDKLYYCISPNSFKENLGIYKKVINHLFY